jgi:glutamate dehydrogenase (NAD(P)+)
MTRTDISSVDLPFESGHFADDLGPCKIIHVYEPQLGLRGTLVVDNVARGPSVGGIRMAEDVSTGECFRLARAMTFKNAAAGLPHGGGKAVIYADPKMPLDRKEQIMRAFACSLAEVEQYVFAPDMGTDEQCMGWIKDEVDRVVGLSRELGGIPLDEIGATGFGLLNAVRVAAERIDLPLEGARLVIQGFGAVGRHAARFLCEAGAVLVGASDSGGTVANPGGLDVAELLALKAEGRSVTGSTGPDTVRGGTDDIIGIPCDIWIPAARPDVIRGDNVERLDTRLVAQGANIPMTQEAEQSLHQRGVLCLPDFIANAGGVICAAMEYRGATESAALQAIEEKIQLNTRAMLQLVDEQQCLPRAAAEQMARARVEAAMASRRWRIF